MQLKTAARILTSHSAVEVRPSQWNSKRLSFWIRDREIAHFEKNGAALDLRVGHEVIKSLKHETFLKNAKIRKDWIEVPLEDLTTAVLERILDSLVSHKP